MCERKHKIKILHETKATVRLEGEEQNRKQNENAVTLTAHSNERTNESAVERTRLE